MRVVFLDRDGTINKDYDDDKWQNKLEPEILQGAIEGMKGLMTLGYKIIIITNQHIINDGIISEGDYRCFTDRLIMSLKQHDVNVFDVFYCPHSERENCHCRKPNKGMIESAMIKYPKITLDKSVLIGDSKCDQDLAKAIGIRFYGINGNYFKTAYNSIEEVYKVLNTDRQYVT